ncbi:hypothetical protein WICPIJ_008139 [Wickerhamomyces pijperi]|uniref:J domain-containing protein n=1 Tax=Wickerhamomyces pijperi TaxID=599730 RepID=A0A9P8TIE6_WICPI|nr:hypothetical protein WICPIJ_008139 [Wickerhamomyces pijperi]
MKFNHSILSAILLSLPTLLTYTNALNQGSEFTQNLHEIDTAYSTSGASFDILNSYEALLQATSEDEVDSIALANVYYKVGILKYSLGKEQQSVGDLLKSFKLNPKNPAVKSTILRNLLKFNQRDHFDDLSSLLEGDEEYQTVKASFDEIHNCLSSNELEKVDEGIALSQFNSPLRLKRIELIKQDIMSISKEEFTTENVAKINSQFIKIIEDYLTLAKIDQRNAKDYYFKISQIYSFQLLEFDNSLTSVKNCLKFDIDDKEYIKTNKILTKYKPLFSKLSEAYKYLQFIELDEKDSDVDIHGFHEGFVGDVASIIEDPAKFIKIRRVNDQDSSINTNFQFLESISSAFNKEYHIRYNNLQLTMVKLGLLNNFNKGKALHASDGNLKTYLQNFQPVVLLEVDQALKHKQFQKAHDLIASKIAKNGQTTSFVRSRLDRIQQHNQQQQRQQQHQQQQQRQRQQQQHHHHQQAPSQPQNDYYKTLQIPKKSSIADVKKAYRGLIKQYHPDKYKGDLPEDKLLELTSKINQAYEVLSDEKTKKEYDDHGIDPYDQGQGQGHGHSQGQRQAQHQQFRQGNPFGGAFGAGGFNFQFNGGGFNFGQQQQHRQQQQQRQHRGGKRTRG